MCWEAYLQKSLTKQLCLRLHFLVNLHTPNNLPIHASSSSSLSARQLLREQQDDEYLASHLADKEKEMNVFHEAATCQLKGDVNKRIEPMEFERRLDAKSASLPCEPAPDDENAVTLLVRMPNGSSLSRHFHKSDRLQVALGEKSVYLTSHHSYIHKGEASRHRGVTAKVKAVVDATSAGIFIVITKCVLQDLVGFNILLNFVRKLVLLM